MRRPEGRDGVPYHALNQLWIASVEHRVEHERLVKVGNEAVVGISITLSGPSSRQLRSLRMSTCKSTTAKAQRGKVPNPAAFQMGAYPLKATRGKGDEQLIMSLLALLLMRCPRTLSLSPLYCTVRMASAFGSGMRDVC